MAAAMHTTAGVEAGPSCRRLLSLSSRGAVHRCDFMDSLSCIFYGSKNLFSLPYHSLFTFFDYLVGLFRLERGGKLKIMLRQIKKKKHWNPLSSSFTVARSFPLDITKASRLELNKIFLEIEPRSQRPLSLRTRWGHVLEF